MRVMSANKPWWSFLLRRPMHFVLDAAILSAAFALAYTLRFELDVPLAWERRAVAQAPFVVATELLALWICGVYSFIWRYVGMREVSAFLRAAVLWTIPIAIVRFLPLKNVEFLRLPVSIIAMGGVFGFVGVLGLRVVRRSLYERFERNGPTRNVRKRPVLLLGAGKAGTLAAREIVGRSDSDLDVKGFIDDDPEKVGSVIHGVKVLATTSSLPKLVREIGIDHVIITIAKASRAEMRRILDICESIPVKARVIPGLSELLSGSVSVSRIRNVEVEDLLGREPVQLDHEMMQRFLTGRVVMVTGAGGSIGSELARQSMRFGPKAVLLVERAEGALFDIDRELRAAWPSGEIIPLVADICDEERLAAIFAEWSPQVVLHAGAHKHVPMMEKNPGEAVKNNVFGTLALGRTAGLHGAETFVLISTDKAVRPTSVMGASKRTAELVVQDLDSQFGGTHFVAVRFGNVLGSAGSVIPIFREQILKGGPVTVTHPDMVRYFMTIPEASQLVLQAGAMGKGGEIFVLDMGEPVKIVDLARDMIRLSGFKPFEDIDIVFTGIRPGEKLFEELEQTGEQISKTRHPKIFIGRISAVDSTALAENLQVLARTVDKDPESVRELLARVVPESRFAPIPEKDPGAGTTPVLAAATS